MEFKRYRFDFTEKVKLMLADFANINKNATRKEFTEAWSKWLSHETIKSFLDSERVRMESEGFEGDVLDKMFKSARYYHKKRDNNINPSERSNTGIKNKNRFSREFLIEMDEYIQIQLMDIKNVVNKNGKIMNTLSQSVAYNSYCNSNKEQIMSEFMLIKNKRGELTMDMVEKLKKTYKNRFYSARKM